MRRLGLSLALLLVTAPAMAADRVVVVETTGIRDDAHLKDAIGRELEAVVVSSADPRAKDAGRISIDAAPANKTLTVAFRKAGEESPPVSRSVALPSTDARIESSAVLLAGNVARDEAADVLRGIDKPNKTTTLPSAKLVLPPPTRAQMDALGMMRESVGAYEKGAKEYREAVASIVKLHYQMKKSAVLGGLDREIALEKAELEKARETAIRRLEELIAKHPTVSPVAPDAMYRLAALYEERERHADAIAMYRRIIHDFPAYREIEGVHYFLGHALNDEGRIREAHDVWRALVSFGKDPKYLAETWWQIGNYEFDLQGDPASLSRAAHAYQQAMSFKREPIETVALYKYSWTLYKQERYELALQSFVKLLERTSEVDFRNEACAYIAASLANAEMIERVKDATLVPQDKPFTIEIYRALGKELESIDRWESAQNLYATMLQRWPNHPSAPDTQNAIADTFAQLAITKTIGTPEHTELTRKAREERTKLASYVGNTPWVDANKDNPSAIRHAESLVRTGLRQVAVQHTNHARAFAMAAKPDLVAAAAEYKLATLAWDAFVKHQDDSGADAYENRYWAADARHKQVALQAKLHESAPTKHAAPTKKEIDEAVLAAIELRDSQNSDAEAIQDNAAFFIVDLADIEQRMAKAPARDDVKFTSNDPATRKVVRDPIPAAVQGSMNARDDYVRLVPAARDLASRAPAYRYWVAETFFLYGHWDRARERFEALWKDRCAVDEFGAKAWSRLVTMAAKERDEARAVALTEAVDPAKGGKSCDAKLEGSLSGPIQREVLFGKARRAFEASSTKGATTTTKQSWREAASLYERVLETSDATVVTIEAGMNAAYAMRQAGEPARAIRLYERVLAMTSSAAAYEALATTHYAAFDYPSAASTFLRAANDPKVDLAHRRDAARNALILDAGLGRKASALAAHGVLRTLKPDAALEAEADLRVAVLEKTNPAKIVAAWDRLKGANASLANEAPFVDYAAEAAFTIIERELTQKFDDPQVHRYGATSAEIVGDPTTKSSGGKYRKNGEEAAYWDLRLRKDVIEKYPSATWIAIAYARQGAIFDTLRTGLYNAVKVKTTTPQMDAVIGALRQAGQTGQTGKNEQADRLEDAARDHWLGRKKVELDAADDLMIQRYAIAAALAKKHGIGIQGHPEIAKAYARLAYFTDILGDVKLGNIVGKTPDPNDPKGTTKLAYTSSMYVVGRPGLASPPTPVQTQTKPTVLAP